MSAAVVMVSLIKLPTVDPTSLARQSVRPIPLNCVH